MPDITRYSLRLDGDRKITPHFRVREFACHDGSDRVLVSTEMVELLEQVRAYYRTEFPGATITINSGYRTKGWNRKVGGVANSEHVRGTAVDFVVRIPNAGIVSPHRVYADIDKGRVFGKHTGGLGSYRSFVHLDTAGTRRWAG